MTNLNCSVQTCAYNSENRCCASGINVDGLKAHSVDGTCCDTFEEKSESFTNCANCQPNVEMGISCKADNCIYNSNYYCTASHVDIGGNGACECSQTKCNTFEER